MKTLQQELIDLLQDDAYAISFQSMRQYRNALIKHLKSINSPEPSRAIGENKQKEKACKHQWIDVTIKDGIENFMCHKCGLKK
jgi:uncharacterized protein with HEPN domain